MTGTNPPMDHTSLARALAAQLPAPEHLRRLFFHEARHRFLPDLI